jgi:hypothetical protein
MSRSLTNSDLTTIANQFRLTADLGLLVEGVLKEFVARGADPFSWKDAKTVLKDILQDPNPREAEKHFNRLTVKVGFGVYSLKDNPSVVAPRAPRASRSEGLSWAPSFIAPDQERESWYGEDAGLRRLALGQVKCFASYSEQDRACGTCPLARFCQEASFAKMDELARLLDQQEEARIVQETEALNAPPVPVTPEAPAPPVTPVAPSVTPSASSSGTIQDVLDVLADLQSRGMTASSPPMPFKGVCSGCSGSVEAGSTVIHVKGRGMFHPVCAQKI